MIPSNGGPVPAELSSDMIDCGAPGPMPQQETGDCHGHEMHPQKFVRLVGCHEPVAEKHEGAHRLNRLAAAYPVIRSFF
jgi:hypothetical protein